LNSPFYLISNHFTLVGLECSHCIVSVTPDAIKPHAFDCALRKACSSVSARAVRQDVLPWKATQTSTRYLTLFVLE
jgi:hypothetical protein